ncbi:MAG: L-2,4-diaminobutyrate decarboxylase [Fluviicola sp.]|nr:MAG: L-2,4-diaminobutyrate decarboxylase [Fluviicola sp.]
MDDLIERLRLLEKESKLLDLNDVERKATFSNFEKIASEFLNELEDGNTYSNAKSYASIFEIKEESENLVDISGTIYSEVMQKGINAASGGHLGYIPGGGLYTSAIGDYLAAVSNAFSGMYYASPGAVEMEYACLNWLKELFDFPKNAIGNLTSGGSIANLIGLTAARDFHKVLDQPVGKSVVYMSKHTHHCVHKALRIIGLANVTVREIELDENNRIKPDHLKELIEKDIEINLSPFLVIASAGTTDTGAMDPLDEVADVAKHYKLWYHIDAAYGGFFKLVETKKALFEGIGKADSLVIDPHKGLFLPYGIGAVLVKNREAVLKSHHYLANYMQDATDNEFPLNPADVSPELTKHFRALRMWLPMKIHGTLPFVAALEEKLLLTEYFRREIVKLGFSIGPEPDLSVTYFWYPKNDSQNEFNQNLLKAFHESGEVFLSSTKLEEKFVIRMAILSFRTHRSTIDKAIEMIKSGLRLRSAHS